MSRLLLGCIASSAMLLAAAAAYAQETPLWSQGDAYNDPAELARSRAAVLDEHGGGTAYYVLGERLEYQSNEGTPLFVFEGQGWWGGDQNKFWLKTEGEYDFGADRFEEAEIQALWSRAITPYFDFQAGLRRDIKPDPSRTYGVIGIQGLAPYWFEVDAALFISGHGDVSARIEAEYDLLLTQRLILQPRTELNFAVQSVEELGIGSGLTSAELGARLRYEIKRQFAPYLGVSWSRSVGETADFIRADGERPGSVSFVAGVRTWF